jgi:hypothetical protein
MRLFLISAFILNSVTIFAQKFVSEKSFVSFYSHATIEDITAKNSKASSIFNSATGEIVYSIPIKDFQFAKTLMQEHFNEKYMDTEKFPKSTFQGKIIGFQQVDGVQQVRAQGKLTIHGVTKDIDQPGTIEVQGKKIQMKSKFMIKLEDYNITRPQLLWQNIAEEVEVTVEFLYKPM